MYNNKKFGNTFFRDIIGGVGGDGTFWEIIQTFFLLKQHFILNMLSMFDNLSSQMTRNVENVEKN